MEQHKRIKTTDITEITRLYQKDFRKSICVTLATKFDRPFQVSLFGILKTVDVVIADSFFNELKRIRTMGYIHKIEMTARIMVATGFFSYFPLLLHLLG